MLLHYNQAINFIDNYKLILLRVLANTGTAQTGNMRANLAVARALGTENPALFETALACLAVEGSPVEPSVAAAIRSLKFARWLYLRQGKRYAVFLDGAAKNAYAVHALTTPLDELLGEPPFFIETGVVAFGGRFVCDGLISSHTALGPGYRAQFGATYSALRKSGKFHTQAPVVMG